MFVVLCTYQDAEFEFERYTERYGFNGDLLSLRERLEKLELPWSLVEVSNIHYKAILSIGGLGDDYDGQSLLTFLSLDRIP